MFASKAICLILIFLICSAAVYAGQLTILTENSPPGSFIDEKGELRGLSVDIVKKIMTRLDLDAPIKVLPWARAYKTLEREANVMLFSTTRTAQRENLFKWVGPLITIEWIFLARKESPIALASLDDARSVDLIGTYREDARQQYLADQGFTNLHSVVEMPQLLKMLEMNRLDLIATSIVRKKQCCTNHDIPMDRFKNVHTFKEVSLYMAFSRQTSDTIVQQWQQVYDELEKEGFLDQVNKKWLR